VILDLVYTCPVGELLKAKDTFYRNSITFYHRLSASSKKHKAKKHKARNRPVIAEKRKSLT